MEHLAATEPDSFQGNKLNIELYSSAGHKDASE